MTKSRTIWVNVIVAILGFLELNLHLVQDNLGDKYGVVFIVIGVLGIYLRAVTTQPLSERRVNKDV